MFWMVKCRRCHNPLKRELGVHHTPQEKGFKVHPKLNSWKLQLSPGTVARNEAALTVEETS